MDEDFNDLIDWETTQKGGKPAAAPKPYSQANPYYQNPNNPNGLNPDDLSVKEADTAPTNAPLPEGYAVVFGDESKDPYKTGFRFTPEQETQLRSAYAQGDIGQVVALGNQFGQGHGITLSRQNVEAALKGGRKADDPNLFSFKPVDQANELARKFDLYRGFDQQPIDELRKNDLLPETADAMARGAAPLGSDPYIDGIITSVLHGGTLTDNIARARTIRDYDAQNHPVARFTGGMLGSLLLPTKVVGVAREAADAARADGIAAGLTEEQIASAAQSAARQAMGRQMIREGALYGAGTGAVSTDGGPLDRLVGAGEGGLIGGIAGKLLPKVAGVLRRSHEANLAPATEAPARDLQGTFSQFTREGAHDIAADHLVNAASGSPSEVMAAIAARPEATPGTSPTLAEVANDIGLAGFQRSHLNTDPNASATVAAQKAENALQRTRAASEVMGDGSPQALQDLGAERVSQAIQEASANRESAASRLTSAIEALGSSADRDATGAEARKAFEESHKAFKQRTNEAYSNPALTKPQPITIPKAVFTKLRQTADAFYGDGGGEIPAKLQSIINDMADTNATTRTLTNIDRRLADFAGEERMAGRNATSAFAESIRGDLGQFARTGTPPAYRDALAAAKALRAEQGRIFETGDAAAAFAKDRYSNPRVGDNALPSKLLRPGASGGDTAQGLINAMGPQAAEAVIRQEIRRVAEEGGISTVAHARQLATRYGEAARRFPSIQNDLTALQQRAAEHEGAIASERIAQRGTSDAARQIGELGDAIQGSPLGRIAHPDVDPSTFVKQLIQKQDNGRQLQTLYRQISGNEDAVGGLRRSLGDYIERAGEGPNFTASGARIPSIIKTRQAIATVTSRAGDILSREQKIVLNRVSRELESANFAETAAKPAGSETAMNTTFVDMLHAAPIPGKGKFVLNKVIESLGNGAQVKRLITRAIADPDFAATLLKRASDRHLKEVVDSEFWMKPVTLSRATNVINLKDRLASGLNAAGPARAAANEPSNETSGVEQNQQDQQYNDLIDYANMTEPQ